jgi:DNA-binding MarR family transcriptional regulator/L-amino acid N-acyltransferase YncA
MNNLSDDAVNQLRQNARTVVRELGLLNDAYFNIGVTLAERHLLIELTTLQSPTMKEIAERLLLDKSTVSRLIAKAVNKGFVKCSPGTSDKRQRLLQITEKGIHTLHAFEPIAFKQTKDALLTLSTQESATVYQGVALYAQGLKNARLKKHGPQQERLLSLSEITEQLQILGCALSLFSAPDEHPLYQIFQEVVGTGLQFPYESSSLQEFHRQFLQPMNKVYVCRTHQGEVIGGFYLKANFPGRSQHIANAAYMLKASYRGKGIGSLLVQASLQLAHELGFRLMQFNLVFSKNEGAINLYQKLGFTITGTLPEAVRNPDGSYQDGYIMHRKL